MLQFFGVPPGGSVVSCLFFSFLLLFVFAALVGAFFRIFLHVFLRVFFVICIFLAFFFCIFLFFFLHFFAAQNVAMGWLLFDEVVTHLCLPVMRSFGNQQSISWSLRSFLEVSVQKDCLPSYVLASS